jgi:hypothetical protein
MTLSPEARQRAREIAEAAPPISPEIKEKIRLILWGSGNGQPEESDDRPGE